jgi:hypothetical protein
MDDNIWEYPFGDLDEDDDIFFRKPERPGDSALRNHRKPDCTSSG